MQRAVAVVLGAVVAGGVAFGVYLTQRDGSAATASSVVGSPTTTGAATPRDPTAPFSAPPPRPSLPGEAMKRRADSARVAPSLTAGAGTDPAAAGAKAPKDSRSAMSDLLGGDRRGVSAIKTRPPRGQVIEKASSFDTLDGRRQQLRMNRTFEAAACRAPDMKQRLAGMTSAEQAKLRARCAKAGVTLPPSEE